MRDNSFSTIDYINNSIKKNTNYITLDNSRDLFVVTVESFDFFIGLRESVYNKALELGYPNLSIQQFDNNSVDCSLGVCIYEYMKSKGIKFGFDLLSDRQLWSNINLYIIPDMIYWRFSQNEKIVHSDRYTTHKRRNYSWYVCMCCYLFEDNQLEDEWANLKALGVDDKVQLIERAKFGYNRIYYNRFVKKVLAYPKNNRKDLIRSLTRLVTFFQSRYSFSFTENHIDAFLNFLLSQINGDLYNYSDSRIDLAADPVVSYASKMTYIKRIVNQDLERTTSISVDAAFNFFSINGAIGERRILIEINQKNYNVLVKKRETRMEFRIFLNTIFKDVEVKVDDLLVFTKDCTYDTFQLNIISKDIFGPIYVDYCEELANENHRIVSWSE